MIIPSFAVRPFPALLMAGIRVIYIQAQTTQVSNSNAVTGARISVDTGMVFSSFVVDGDNVSQ